MGDSLWLSSSIPGFVYWRNENSGSPYIQAWCKYMDSVTPAGKPIRDVLKAHHKATAELVGTVPLDQIPSIGLSTIGKLVGFLPTSNGLKYKNPAN